MARWFKAAVPSAIVICMAGYAMAQGGPAGDRGMWGNGPAWGMGSGWHMGMGMWGNWRGGASDWMLDRIEGRLAFAKTELKITDAQSAAWNRLAEAIRAAAKTHNQRLKSIFAGNERPRTLPERVEAQEKLMTARIEEIRSIKVALQELYALLSDEQKKEADELDIPMVGMMGGPWG